MRGESAEPGPTRAAGFPFTVLGMRLAIPGTVSTDQYAAATVVGEATDGEQAVSHAATTRPDVVLMDIRMPGTDGLEAIRRIAGRGDLAGVRVLILTTFESDNHIYEALRCGVSGFVVKDTEPADLVKAVRVIASGDSLLSPSVTRRLIADIAAQGRPAETDYLVNRLTERERKVLTLVGRGQSNDEIARSLILNPLTAKTLSVRLG